MSAARMTRAERKARFKLYLEWQENTNALRFKSKMHRLISKAIDEKDINTLNHIQRHCDEKFYSAIDQARAVILHDA